MSPLCVPVARSASAGRCLLTLAVVHGTLSSAALFYSVFIPRISSVKGTRRIPEGHGGSAERLTKSLQPYRLNVGKVCVAELAYSDS